MKLTKIGETYTGNSTKYFSRDKAVSRLESLVTSFMFGCARRTDAELMPNCGRLSFSDRKRLTKAIDKIGLWCVVMESEALPDEEGDVFTLRNVDSIFAPGKNKPQEKYYSPEHYINLLETDVTAFLLEANKLKPIAQNYQSLKPEQKERFADMIAGIGQWVLSSHERIAKANRTPMEKKI